MLRAIINSNLTGVGVGQISKAPTPRPGGSPDPSAFELSRPRGGRYAWLT